jgi:prepilin-type processing-associated H-X9-DG protein
VFNSKKLGPFTSGWLDDYVRSAAFQFLGRTTYMGVAGCGSGDHPFFSRYEGIYTNRVQHSLGQVAVLDGTSNTLLYGEACGTQWNSQPESKDIAWMAGGGLGTYLGLHKGRDASLITFSSFHTGGVQFCFADGSVRTIRYGQTKWDGSLSTPFTNDWQLLQQLAGFRDGAAADTASILE